jgi:hypothetical protein
MQVKILIMTMKPFLLFTFSFFLSTMLFCSCKKETVTNTHTVYDTVQAIKSSNILILTSHVWEEQETYADLSGTTTHYIRGGENTTGADQDTLRLTFVAGGTGSAVAENGSIQPLLWSFTSSDSTNMDLSIGGSPFSWHDVSISDTAILETTPLADGDLSSAKWVPVP